MGRTLLFLIILASYNICQAEEYLSTEQIKTLVTGKTATGRHLRRDIDLVTFFAKDGQVIGLADGNKRKGKWWINDANLQCIKWDHKDKAFCSAVKDNGDGTYDKIKFKKKRKKKIAVVRWTKFEDGNKIDK